MSLTQGQITPASLDHLVNLHVIQAVLLSLLSSKRVLVKMTVREEFLANSVSVSAVLMCCSVGVEGQLSPSVCFVCPPTSHPAAYGSVCLFI